MDIVRASSNLAALISEHSFFACFFNVVVWLFVLEASLTSCPRDIICRERRDCLLQVEITLSEAGSFSYFVNESD